MRNSLYAVGMETLKQARTRARVTVAEAAGFVGVHVATVYRWEAGEVDIPAPAFMRLMRLYKADPWGVDFMSKADKDAKP